MVASIAALDYARFRMRRLWPLLAALMLTAACATARSTLAPLVTPGGVRFMLNQPGARSVAVAGTFNGWSASSHALVFDGAHQQWTLVVPLPPGEHLFMYVVDGVWLSPPNADDWVEDGFGARNGLVVVPPAER